MTDRAITSSGHYPRDVSARGGDNLSPVQQEICSRIMECESVRSICRDPDMPSRSTVLTWLAQDEAFRLAYALAKQLSAEQIEEEVLEIADDSSGDFFEGENGLEFDREHVARAKLRIDARKWAAAKRNPKKYGDASLIRLGEIPSERRELSHGDKFARLAAIAARAKDLRLSEEGEE